MNKKLLVDKLNALLDMECDWPVFHRSKDGLSYEVQKVKVREIAVDSEYHERSIFNLINGQAEFLLRMKKNFLDSFREQEPEVDLKEFMQYMHCNDPEHAKLFERYSKLLEDDAPESFAKAEVVLRQMQGLSPREERIEDIVDKLPTALSEHRDTLMIVAALDEMYVQQIGRAYRINTYFDSIKRLTKAISEKHAVSQKPFIDAEIALLRKKYSDASHVLNAISEFAYEDRPANFTLGKRTSNQFIPEEMQERMRVYRDATQVAVQTLQQFIGNVDKIIMPYWEEIQSQSAIKK